MFIDREGRVAAYIAGPVDADSLDRSIERRWAVTRSAVVLAPLVALVLAGPAAASEARPTLEELEQELTARPARRRWRCRMRPWRTRSGPSSASGSRRATRRARSRTSLVAEFGEGMLAAPPHEGFNLLAWVLPLRGSCAPARWSAGWPGARQGRAAAGAAQGDPSLNGRQSLARARAPGRRGARPLRRVSTRTTLRRRFRSLTAVSSRGLGEIGSRW